MQKQKSPDDKKLPQDPDMEGLERDQALPNASDESVHTATELSKAVENASSLGTIPDGSEDRWIPQESEELIHNKMGPDQNP